MYLYLSMCVMSSEELQKPAVGQPTVSEVLDLVLKECKKENLVYKMAALRSAADILESTQTDRFQEITEVVLPIIKKVQLTTLFSIKAPELWHFSPIDLHCNIIPESAFSLF